MKLTLKNGSTISIDPRCSKEVEQIRGMHFTKIEYNDFPQEGKVNEEDAAKIGSKKAKEEKAAQILLALLQIGPHIIGFLTQ